jgi:lactate dehydrogenase-like 2-hydroxyacid dehydrogenase
LRLPFDGAPSLYAWILCLRQEDRALGELTFIHISATVIGAGRVGQSGISFLLRIFGMPIAVAARSKARNVFARCNTEIVGSNLTEAWMFVCVLCAFFLFLHSLK